jgi:hypothetical protein
MMRIGEFVPAACVSTGAWLSSPKGIRSGYILFFLYFAFTSVGYHNKVDLADWKSVLKADAAGYYVFLPGLFHHGFRTIAIKDEVAEFAANGFTIDRHRDRIVSKYTCGVAYFLLPGYLVAEMIEGYGVTDGWSRTHHQMVQITAILFWVLGLYFIGAALRRWWPTTHAIALVTLACIAFGTNSFYYAFRAPGYSHVYSFFLVALALYCIYADEPGQMRRRMRWIFVGANALLFLIRPIDAIAVLALFALLRTRHPDMFRSPRLYMEQAVVGFLVCLPQLAYWKYVHGQWIYYSYSGEGFSNWANPLFAEVLMAPYNGLLPNSPAYFLLPFGIAVLYIQDRRVATTLLITFVAILYSCAAWHHWQFGCGYGMRPLVQYTPFLAMGLWALFSRTRAQFPALWHGAVPILVLVCFIHYRAMLEYGACYVGFWWQWDSYTFNILEAFFGKLERGV